MALPVHVNKTDLNPKIDGTAPLLSEHTLAVTSNMRTEHSTWIPSTSVPSRRQDILHCPRPIFGKNGASILAPRKLRHSLSRGQKCSSSHKQKAQKGAQENPCQLKIDGISESKKQGEKYYSRHNYTHDHHRVPMVPRRYLLAVVAGGASGSPQGQVGHAHLRAQ